MNTRLLGISVVAILLCLCNSGEVLAQESGSIVGTVTDSTSGEMLPGVNVVIVGTQQGSSADEEGRYEIPNVEPGTYEVQASLSGTKTRFDVWTSLRARQQLLISRSAPGRWALKNWWSWGTELRSGKT